MSKKDDWLILGIPIAVLGMYALSQQQGGLEPKILEFIKKVKVKIYGQTTFERTIDFSSKYVKLFHAQKGMALIGIEDRDEGLEPDGWTDILLPIFYGTAPNQGGVTYSIIFMDGFMSGAYTKELYLFSRGQWHRVLYYSVKTGLRFYGPEGPMTSVGYVEYDPETDRIYHPVGIL